ncbi:hypothetical protein [Ensifer sp. SSB1]|uniref:MurR/RpiR family transcriptional regulator n=1 Tax=Ensifer sp. SSB1 TaxID=2795385 RepID=UPI001A5C335F|nr:MurR/RpiR family transcriptional regulator [Ensifer sp. SSB1]
MSEAAFPKKPIGPAKSWLKQRIVERRIALPASPRRAMHRILSQPEIVAFGTVKSVAAACGVSGTTIGRLCSRVGYESFGEMRRVLQKQLALHAASYP